VFSKVFLIPLKNSSLFILLSLFISVIFAPYRSIAQPIPQEVQRSRLVRSEVTSGQLRRALHMLNCSKTCLRKKERSSGGLRLTFGLIGSDLKADSTQEISLRVRSLSAARNQTRDTVKPIATSDITLSSSVISVNGTAKDETGLLAALLVVNRKIVGLRRLSGREQAFSFRFSLSSTASPLSVRVYVLDRSINVIAAGSKAFGIPLTPTASSSPSPTSTPIVNSSFPTGRVGISAQRIKTTSVPFVKENDVNTFRTDVAFSHFNYDDPIVFPGRPGATHLHLFFGNTKIDAFTVPEKIRENCLSNAAGGSANCSGYWIPAILDEGGKVVTPLPTDGNLIYYKTGHRFVPPQDAQRQVMPPIGFRMIAGTMRGSPSNPQLKDVVSMYCDANGGWRFQDSFMPNCAQGDKLVVVVRFPRCWNGRDLDSPDHQSHVAYIRDGKNCPTSHPVILPEITYNLVFSVRTPGGTSKWSLSSDMYDTKTQRGGYSLHGDWINGWDPAVSKAWLENCGHRLRDCSINKLGDGRELIFDW
jgi:Domain of unknown function (DUF1996)